jgi:hypothetical protein
MSLYSSLSCLYFSLIFVEEAYLYFSLMFSEEEAVSLLFASVV